MKIAIQCTDRMTGDVGCFLHFGDFRAVSKVYPDCVSLFDACHRLNIKLGGDEMFEQTLQEMSASIYIHPERYQMLTASNVGVNPRHIFPGEHIYTMPEALDAISSIDKVLPHCPKYLRKKILAERNAFVFAFGPEMEEVVGVAH